MSSENTSLTDRIVRTQRNPSNANIVDIDSLSLSEQEAKRAKNKRYNQDTADRKWLAIWAASSVTLWLSSVIFLLFCNNNKFSFEFFSKKIEIMPHVGDSVLITLLATTTLNVLGLTFIVLRGHFNSTEVPFKDESIKPISDEQI